MNVYDERQEKEGHLNAKPDDTGKSVCERCPRDYVVRLSLTGLL
jgi:hypothetical protein